MASEKAGNTVRSYLGVDVGGTKIQASLIEESGTIRGRERCPTPRKGGPDAVLAVIEEARAPI